MLNVFTFFKYRDIVPKYIYIISEIYLVVYSYEHYYGLYKLLSYNISLNYSNITYVYQTKIKSKIFVQKSSI